MLLSSAKALPYLLLADRLGHLRPPNTLLMGDGGCVVTSQRRGRGEPSLPCVTSQRAYFFQSLFFSPLQLDDKRELLLVNCVVVSWLSADVLLTLTSDLKLLNGALASFPLASSPLAAVAAASLLTG